jgi:hypothetical protein
METIILKSKSSFKTAIKLNNDLIGFGVNNWYGHYRGLI